MQDFVKPADLPPVLVASPEFLSKVINLVANLRPADRLSRYKIIIDCETLSLANNAAILQIGAVLFDLYAGEFTIIDRFVMNVDPKEQIESGKFNVNQQTEIWWEARPDDVKASVFSNQVSIKVVMAALVDKVNEWMARDTEAQVKIYHRGYDFDGPILRNACRYIGAMPLMKFNRLGCVRNFINERMGLSCGFIPGVGPIDERRHNALADCTNDAYQMWLAEKIQARTMGAKITHDLNIQDF